MKYVAKDMGEAAEASSGGGRQWLELGKLSAMTLCLFLIIYWLINLLTAYVVAEISIEDEKRWLGRVELISKQLSIAEPSEALKQANALLDQLTQHPQVPQLNYQLIAIDSPKINAFAFPGGLIGITQGLLDKLPQKNALAFVIAHELGHFKHRHHLKGLSRNISLSVVFAILFGNDGELLITQNALSILTAQHSQQQEQDSDAFAVKLVSDSFAQVDNIDGFFQLLTQEEPASIEFLSTHPSSQSRIENIHKILRELASQKSN